MGNMKEPAINRDLELIDGRLIQYFTSLSNLLKEKFQKDFRIFEGHRTAERQEILLKKGFSKTKNSKHLFKPSKAIDIIEFPWSWKGFILTSEYKTTVNDHLKKFPHIQWGGNWKTFIDLPHHEIKEK